MNVFQRIGRFLWRHPFLHREITRPLYKRLVRQREADYPFVADFFGLRYEGNLNNNIDYAVYYFGAFEKPVLYFMRDTLRQVAPEGTGVFIDIGANVGHHSLFMSRHAARVHAFEPYAPVRRKLEERMARNAIDNIEVHPLGLGDENERKRFYVPDSYNEGLGSFSAHSEKRGNRPGETLEVVRGDDFLPRLDLAAIHLLKIDVEGFEKPVMEGLRETMRRYRPVLVVEITFGETLSFASCRELRELLPPDYELYMFKRRTASGRKTRIRNARNRVSGHYDLVPFDDSRILSSGHDDVVAWPGEKR